MRRFWETFGCCVELHSALEAVDGSHDDWALTFEDIVTLERYAKLLYASLGLLVRLFWKICDQSCLFASTVVDWMTTLDTTNYQNIYG